MKVRLDFLINHCAIVEKNQENYPFVFHVKYLDNSFGPPKGSTYAAIDAAIKELNEKFTEETKS